MRLLKLTVGLWWEMLDVHSLLTMTGILLKTLDTCVSIVECVEGEGLLYLHVDSIVS